MRTGGLAALFALGGCQLVFGLDPGADPKLDAASDAAPSTASCGPFGSAITALPVSLGSTRFDPQASTDPAELWLTSSVGGTRDVYRARRQGAAFEMLENMAFNSGTAADVDPSLTGDGALLFFVSDRSDANEAYQVEQSNGIFGNPALVAGLPSPIESLDVSADGLAVYFNDVERTLYVARRQTRMLAFSPPTELGITGVDPAISADELELYYDAGDQIVRRTRPSKDLPFGPEESPLASGGPLLGGAPDLSPDLTRLLFVANGDVFEISRKCQ